MNQRFEWLLPMLVEELHDEQLFDHGGAPGLRDRGGLEAALERPKMAAHYDPALDVFAVAALYAHAISKRHPFVDGNKRAGFAAALTFLEINGHRVTASLDDRYEKMYALASGTLAEDDFAAWLRGVTVPNT